MKKVGILTALLFFILFANAQVGIGTVTPDASAVLDITAADKGILIPRVSLVNVTNGSSPIDTPTIGLLIWNTNASAIGSNGVGFYYWSGTQWQYFDGKSDIDGSNDGSSVFIGINSGTNDDSTNNQNVGIGYGTLAANTTGQYNTAVGNSAGLVNTTGGFNSFFGRFAKLLIG